MIYVLRRGDSISSENCNEARHTYVQITYTFGFVTLLLVLMQNISMRGGHLEWMSLAYLVGSVQWPLWGTHSMRLP